MIRLVPAGDLGLDVLLGGGFRLVKRLPEKESATVLVRGGAGAGKTLVALHAAIELAKALGGDVAVGCVEILPSEYAAQIQSARADIDDNRVVLLPAAAGDAAPPRVFCGLLTDLDPDAPDLVASLEALGRDVIVAGGKPAVFVVDSLIEGYGIGASTPRASADAVMKFAALGGYGLVLCEETQGGGASPWIFTADTVVEVGVEARERGRWIEVRKHRFGASVSGRHELDLGGAGHPEVFPEPAAWVARDIREILRAHGWKPSNGSSVPSLVWDDALHLVQPTPEPRLSGAFVVIAGEVTGVARSLALGLHPGDATPGLDLIVELDPLVVRETVRAGTVVGNGARLHYLPTVHGPTRALRRLVGAFAGSLDDRAGQTGPRRVVIGDLAAVDRLTWNEAIRIFASLVVDSGWGIPVIAYTTGPSILSDHADLRIDALDATAASAVQRGQRRGRSFNWRDDVTTVTLSRLDDFPVRPGR